VPSAALIAAGCAWSAASANITLNGNPYAVQPLWSNTKLASWPAAIRQRATGTVGRASVTNCCGHPPCKDGVSSGVQRPKCCLAARPS
jgi:hypothetical protein